MLLACSFQKSSAQTKQMGIPQMELRVKVTKAWKLVSTLRKGWLPTAPQNEAAGLWDACGVLNTLCNIHSL